MSYSLPIPNLGAELVLALSLEYIKAFLNLSAIPFGYLP